MTFHSSSGVRYRRERPVFLEMIAKPSAMARPRRHGKIAFAWENATDTAPGFLYAIGANEHAWSVFWEGHVQ